MQLSVLIFGNETRKKFFKGRLSTHSYELKWVLHILRDLGLNPINIHHRPADYRWYQCGSLNPFLKKEKYKNATVALFTDNRPIQQGTSMTRPIERCHIVWQLMISLLILFPQAKRTSFFITKMLQARGVEKKMRKAFILTTVLENHIPNDVHISFHLQIKEQFW